MLTVLCFVPMQEETFPNQYGECECTIAACSDVFTLCGTSFSLQQDLFAGATSGTPGGPSIITGQSSTVYSFNGRDDLSDNWLTISAATKNTVLQRTDDFTLSFWILVEENSNSAYIITFENGNSRYFSLYEASQTRLILYYFRDNIPGVVNDDARNTQVALSFYYDTTLLPNGLRDGNWHFLSFTVDFPSVILNVDGLEIRPTQGNYQNQFQTRILLGRDGTLYDMPAPILTKDASLLNSIEGRIGGSARGVRFTLFGEVRQLILSDIVDTATYNCLASCNNRIDIDPASTIGSSFGSRYDPVSRVFYFTGAVAPSQYTIFLQSLIYYSNGFLPPEEQGERRIIRLQVEDEVGVGNIAQITITGRSNQNDPVFDANGDTVDGINFAVSFLEGEDTQVSILSPQAFITDDDIESRIDWVTVNITNPELSSNQEFLNLIDTPPSVLSVTGSGTYSINITAADPTQTTANIFITALLSVRYNNFANEPVNVDRVIEFTVFDGLRTNTPPATATIDIQTIDDVPVADLNGPAPGVNGRQEYIESSPPTRILSNLILIDPDSFDSITDARARIDTVFDMGNESIAFDSSLLPPGVTCLPASCNGTVILITGTATVPQYERFLGSLQYVNLQQSIDLPNLRDRVVYVTVSDGVSTSDPNANIVIDIIPVNPRVIIELAAPNQNFVTIFEEDQLTPIPCTSNVRVVDTSIQTLESIVISIRDNLPAGVEEDLEMISVTSITGLDISIEINTALKRITFSQVAPVSQYVDAIQRVRYFNGENEPYQIKRFVDFFVIPGGGAPNDTTFCNITIENRNDNGPVCEPGNPTVEVREDTSANTIITTLIATDIDVGVDGELFYTLVSGDAALFSVESNGSVILLGGLDREMVDEYQLSVEACDMGSPQLCCIFNTTITVTDANDQPPVFSQDRYEVSIDENSVANVVSFNISDQDIGVNSDLAQLEILQSSYSPRAGCLGRFVTNRFPVPSISTVSPGLDFETTDTCVFVVVATDGGSPALSGSANVQVSVNNVDDIPPVFSMGAFTFEVEEENPVGLDIGQVTATDVDSPTIEYSLDGTTQFSIDPDSGNISINFVSDRDVQIQYSFTAVATDPASNTASASVTVNIVPINNDAPTLDLNASDPNTLNVEVPVVFEEEGDSVLIVTEPSISDPDELALSISRIRIRVANSGNAMHEVLSVNPVLSSTYTLLSSTPGTLIIQPVNPTNLNEVYALLRGIEYDNTEDELSDCRADLYPCSFGPASRTILFAVEDGRFFSNESAAYVTFTLVNDAPVVDLDSAGPGFDFTTRFIEGAGPISIANTLAGFEVSDDDNANLQRLDCVLTNPIDLGDEFIQLNSSLPSGLTATFSANETVLQITGDVSVEDYRTALSLIVYNSNTSNPSPAARVVDVYVFDGELTSLIATTTITFEIVNEVPELDLDILSLTVNFSTTYFERGSPAQLSGTPVVFDVDDINMLRLEATLFGGNNQESIVWNPSTLSPGQTASFVYPTLSIQGIANVGVYLNIIGDITYDNRDSEIADISPRLVEFVITDEKGGESLPAYAIVNIMPVDDNPPVFFPSNVYNFTVEENSPSMTLVGTVEVRDADLPPGQDVPTFSITSTSGSSLFMIRNNPLNPYQGQVLVISQIDYDTTIQSYNIDIQAASTSFTSTATVLISIINLPDLPPEFTNCPPEFSVMENEDTFAPLMPSACIAVDADGIDSITYSISGNIVGGLALVDIFPNTGGLFVANNIDREIVGTQFRVTVTASDSLLSASRNITVIILGENEFPPVFDQASYSGEVTENMSPTGTAVVTVRATDADELPDLTEDPNLDSSIVYILEDLTSPAPSTTYFDINNSTGEIFQTVSIDFEETPQFVLQVTAIDGDVTPIVRTAIVNVIIQVQNINDEPPFFENIDPIIIVSELLPTQVVFYDVVFGDPDPDSSLSLQFQPPAPLEFLLNSATGELSTLRTLDADTEPREYNYTLILIDRNSDVFFPEQRMVSTNITIAVQDANDIVPQFSQDVYEDSITENAAPASVLQVAATDGDYGFDTLGNPNGNNELIYFFINAPIDIFEINETTGVISQLRPVDREQQAEYEFTVAVRDNPDVGAAMVDTALVRIQVQDINEFPPLPDPENYFAFVSEEAPLFTEIETFVEVAWNYNSKWETYTSICMCVWILLV